MIHHVYANRSNVGDWLSARGIQSLLAPAEIREHLCDEPFVPDTLAALSRATERDFIVIGGGGLFMDYFAPFWDGFRPIATRVPFAIWGVGCCDVKHSPTRPPLELVSAIIRQSRLTIVRDELTRSLFPECSLPPPVACPAVNAVPDAPPAKEPRILHVDHYNDVGPAVFERMQSIAEAFAAATGRTVARTNNVIRKDDAAALEFTLNLYRSADIVLTSRLHGCILSAALGRTFVAVSGDAKVDSFIAAAGMDRWVCPPDEVDRLPDLLEAALRDQLPLATFAARTRAANRAIAERIRAFAAG